MSLNRQTTVRLALAHSESRSRGKLREKNSSGGKKKHNLGPHSQVHSARKIRSGRWQSSAVGVQGTSILHLSSLSEHQSKCGHGQNQGVKNQARCAKSLPPLPHPGLKILRPSTSKLRRYRKRGSLLGMDHPAGSVREPPIICTESASEGVVVGKIKRVTRTYAIIPESAKLAKIILVDLRAA